MGSVDVRQHNQLKARETSRQLLRFDRVERGAHWVNALLFGILILTALPLYFAQIETIVGRRELIAQIHLWSGVSLPVPLIISLMGPWGTRVREDIRHFCLWTNDEIRWLVTFGRRRMDAMDKFNPGQKMNALFVGGAIAVMLASGCILKWFRFFPVDWRTGATFVHDVLALMILVVVIGHIAFALTHRDALRSIFRGRVSEAWAKQHAGKWLAAQRARSTAPNRH